MKNERDTKPSRVKRRVKLIKPRIQLRLVGWFAGIAAVALLLQFTLLAMSLSELAIRMPAGGDYLSEATPGMLLSALAISFGVLLPLILGLGISITFRLAGPVYRFEQHLGSVARGEDIGECRIREGDELQELCVLINAALDTARRGAPPASEVPAEARPERASA